MSLHDKLAQEAISMGKSTPEFTAAAQKHANATWFYVIAAGIVWYFFGWVWALIPIALGVYTAFQSVSATMIATRLESQEKDFQSSDTDFVQIVQAYGKTLETSAPAPGTVADINKLPYPKQQIKDAIVAALRMTDDSQIKEHLKVGYIQLSDWQEGVGESNQGLDVSALDMSQDTQSLAKAVLEQASGSEKWMAIAQKEQEALKQELQALGLW
ncbi:MAG: hypothetical protein ACOY4L_00655 [Pseudomonadota bacterium]